MELDFVYLVCINFHSDLSNNPLACDCGLIWLIAWSNARDIRLQPPPKCDSPINFRGMPLKKLKVGIDFRCESLLQPLLELVPKQNQVRNLNLDDIGIFLYI